MKTKHRITLSNSEIEIILSHLGWLDSWDCRHDEPKYSEQPEKEEARKKLYNKFAKILDWSPE